LSNDSLREGTWASSTEVKGLAESIQTQLRKGVLELCVLTLLSRGDSYGYEIASRLMQEVGMGEGTIYPLMRRMQDDGQVSTYLMEAPGGPPRKYYRITETGRATLKAQREEWKNFMTSIEKMLGDAP
jgi:PadR family transcriptional regulator, regulatory protein PadR